MAMCQALRPRPRRKGLPRDVQLCTRGPTTKPGTENKHARNSDCFLQVTKLNRDGARLEKKAKQQADQEAAAEQGAQPPVTHDQQASSRPTLPKRKGTAPFSHTPKCAALL